MRYLLDTNICVFIFRRKSPPVLQRLYQTQPGEVGISAVVLAELRYGADKSSDPRKNHAVINVFLTTVLVSEFNEDAARTYGTLRTQLTCPTEVQVVGTFPVPFTEFLGESRSRGRHTECACYFCRTRHNWNLLELPSAPWTP